MNEQPALPGVPLPLPKETARSLSISKVQAWLRCGAAYWYRYEAGLRTPPRSFQILGTAVHSGIEHNLRKKIETQQDLPLSEVQEVFSANFDYLKGKALWERDEDVSKTKDDGVRLVALYQREVAPSVKPKLVEHPATARFDNVPWTFSGIFDLVDESGLIADTKTTCRAPSAIDVHKSLQLTAYSFLLRAGGQRETGLRYDYLVRAKTPRLVQIETTRSDSEIEQFLKLLGHVSHAIFEERRFLPNPTSPYCGPRFCPYWDSCEAGKKFDYEAASGGGVRKERS